MSGMCYTAPLGERHVRLTNNLVERWPVDGPQIHCSKQISILNHIEIALRYEIYAYARLYKYRKSQKVIVNHPWAIGHTP